MGKTTTLGGNYGKTQTRGVGVVGLLPKCVSIIIIVYVDVPYVNNTSHSVTHTTVEFVDVLLSHLAPQIQQC